MSYELNKDELQQIVSWTELSDGSRRAFYHWPTEGSLSSANVLIVPGLGEHGGRYGECARFLSRQGLDVQALDLIGHGLSPGERGCIASYEGLLDEIGAAIEVISARNSKLPVVLWGHSMGGNLVLNYLLRRENLPHCAIVSGPMLRAANPPSDAFLWFARRLTPVLPNYRLNAPVQDFECTRDPQQRQYMSGDRLFHRFLSLRLGAALIDSGQWALEHAQQLRTPLLLLHSQQDKITSPRASEEFAARSGRYCQLTLLPEQLHDVHRDLGSDAILQSMSDWIRARLLEMS